MDRVRSATGASIYWGLTADGFDLVLGHGPKTSLDMVLLHRRTDGQPDGNVILRIRQMIGISAGGPQAGLKTEKKYPRRQVNNTNFL